MELLAIRYHAWLSRLRRLYAIARTRGWCWIGSSSYYANADIDFRPHARAIVFDHWVHLTNSASVIF